jgi:hypothetical protein
MTVTSLKRFDRMPAEKAPLSLAAGALQALAGLHRAAALWFTSARPVDTTADDLLDRAAAYEATQPGYAADLRAAALQARGLHVGC